MLRAGVIIAAIFVALEWLSILTACSTRPAPAAPQQPSVHAGWGSEDWTDPDGRMPT